MHTSDLWPFRDQTSEMECILKRGQNSERKRTWVEPQVSSWLVGSRWVVLLFQENSRSTRHSGRCSALLVPCRCCAGNTYSEFLRRDLWIALFSRRISDTGTFGPWADNHKGTIYSSDLQWEPWLKAEMQIKWNYILSFYISFPNEFRSKSRLANFLGQKVEAVWRSTEIFTDLGNIPRRKGDASDLRDGFPDRFFWRNIHNCIQLKYLSGFLIDASHDSPLSLPIVQ